MSNELLNLGMSGMLAQSRSMSIIGNNIANSRTAGFKAGTMSFSEAFNSQDGSQLNGIQNQRGQGVNTTGTSYDWSSGTIKDTGVMTHVSIIGDGFLPVQYKGETVYSRAGDFSLIESSTTAGNFILMRPNGSVLMKDDGASGLDFLEFTNVPNSIEISPRGAVNYTYTDMDATSPTYQQNITTNVGQLVMQRFANPDSLTHLEGGLYEPSSQTTTAGDPSNPGTVGAGTLRQGSLEEANVDLVREFTDMISAQRAFQANSRSVTTADSMLQEVLSMKR